MKCGNVKCWLTCGYHNVYTLSGKHIMNSFAQQRRKFLQSEKSAPVGAGGDCSGGVAAAAGGT